ncbi:zinc-binding dehydrogenase [Algoriphagus sp. CAU 1675]|uniref:zinc-binding dehydrogenase n=1 Tax=Algoriphagus sp. CAU 1675 TaxID=3032597 RepID=UPI0023D97F00|nr:zinc-binding dehydrogenase [Algoriphagus sp. CAU 1675]MDF2157850.1 zinc-binding dehydrogenase [Algoriphagus sp. CAU 1675]
MKGIVLNRSLPSGIEFKEVNLPELKPGEVKVAIKAAALNHRDEWCRQGLYRNLEDGKILGSDGAGIVVAVGSEFDSNLIGKQVLVNPALNWGDNQLAQNEHFDILGMPSNGTLAEELIVPKDRIYEKPFHLTWEEAAALPLAGLTAFRALTYQGQVQAGENVLITGFGGGVAQFAAQFAISLGAKVSVSSSDVTKLEKAKEIGVLHTFNYKNEDWTERALASTGGFDLIIDSASGNSINNLIQVAKPGGRIVIYGATTGNPESFNARKVYWNQLKIMGSTMGSDRDFEQMLEFVNQYKIRPIIDQVFSLDQAEVAFDRMRSGTQMGKIVLVP